MKAILLTLLVLIVLVVVWYAAYGREWLKGKPWAQGFFAAVEPWEIFLYKKSETILFARLKMLTGALLGLLTMLGGIDLTMVTPLVPEEYQGYVNFAISALPFAISIVGLLDERLRNTTTKPLELVAIPETAPVSPEVAAVVEAADMTKAIAVAVVKGEENALVAAAAAEAFEKDDANA